MMRAMAESVDSETLNATTCDWLALMSLIMSSIAPTLFGRNTENCLTSGPSRLEVISGIFRPMQFALQAAAARGERVNYVASLLGFANGMLGRRHGIPGAKTRCSRSSVG